ncbi:MAG: hypothetical protein AAB660_00190 [Patescibacteria group bacterium]
MDIDIIVSFFSFLMAGISGLMVEKKKYSAAVSFGLSAIILAILIS